MQSVQIVLNLLVEFVNYLFSNRNIPTVLDQVGLSFNHTAIAISVWADELAIVRVHHLAHLSACVSFVLLKMAGQMAAHISQCHVDIIEE